MAQDQKNPSGSLRFSLGDISKTAAPDEDSAAEWYSYTIEHEKTRIVGKRSGTLQSVKRYLEEYVEQLNARPSWGYSSYAPKKNNK